MSPQITFTENGHNKGPLGVYAGHGLIQFQIDSDKFIWVTIDELKVILKWYNLLGGNFRKHERKL